MISTVIANCVVTQETRLTRLFSKNWLPIGALFCSLIVFAFVPLLIRRCEMEISPSATMFNRFWIAALVLSLWQGVRKIGRFGWQAKQTETVPSDTSSSDQSLHHSFHPNAPLLLLWGVTVTVFALNPTIWAWSITQTSIANATLLHDLCPLFTTFGSWLIFKAQFNRQFLLGIVISVLGAIALGINDFQLDSYCKIQGDLIAFVSAILFAAHLMCVERLRLKFTSSSILLWCCTAGMIITMLITLGLGQPLFPVSLAGWQAAIELSLIGQLLAGGLIVYSLSQLSASFVALALLLNPVLSAIAAQFILHETLNLWNIVAFATILSGVYLGLSADSSAKTITI